MTVVKNKTLIHQFCSWFESEIQEAEKIKINRHRDLVLCSVIDALGRVYDRNSGSKKRFMNAVADLSNWSESQRFSLPQLKLNLEACGEKNDTYLYKLVESRLGSWPVGSLIDLDKDLRESDIDMTYINRSENKNILESSKHIDLLYSYRSCLVHEIRKPGYGWDFAGTRVEPYYVSMSSDFGETWELTYPEMFFVELAKSTLKGLESWLVDKNRNPYEAFEFGSVWKHYPK